MASDQKNKANGDATDDSQFGPGCCDEGVGDNHVCSQAKSKSISKGFKIAHIKRANKMYKDKWAYYIVFKGNKLLIDLCVVF